MCLIVLIGSTEAPTFNPEESLIGKQLTKLGADVRFAVWEEGIPKGEINLIRSTWNYPEKLKEFKRWLEQCQENVVPLFPSPDLAKRFLGKEYIPLLAEKGIRVIPTVIFPPDLPFGRLEQAVPGSWQKLVVKPVFSNSGKYVQLLNARNDLEKAWDTIGRNRALVVQKYMDEFSQQGEFSAIFINGQFSHAVQKIPHSGDYRVNARYGGKVIPSELDPDSIAFAKNALLTALEPDNIQSAPIARIDFISTRQGLCISEVEIIEPYLYLEYVDSKHTEFVAKGIWNRFIHA